MRQIDEMIESDTQTLRAHAIYNKANIDVFDQKRNQSNRRQILPLTLNDAGFLVS